jgi:hypothetical protein
MIANTERMWFQGNGNVRQEADGLTGIEAVVDHLFQEGDRPLRSGKAHLHGQLFSEKNSSSRLVSKVVRSNTCGIIRGSPDTSESWTT